MWKSWKELGEFEISEQRMADQVRTIIKKKWFTTEDLDEIRRYKKNIRIKMGILEQP